MDDVKHDPGPRRVGPVEPELLGTAIFLFSEYLAQLAADRGDDDEAASDEEEETVPVDTRAVLDLFAEELGTDVATTLNIWLRVTALFRLLAGSPSLARLACEAEEGGGSLTETALLAAARLDLYVERQGSEGSADFDPREFREALDED